jgi:glycerol-3-phosphate acyltransferase PlsY
MSLNLDKGSGNQEYYCPSFSITMLAPLFFQRDGGKGLANELGMLNLVQESGGVIFG